MSYEALMEALDEKLARFAATDASAPRVAHPPITVGCPGHGMDNAPSMLFDYARSAPRPTGHLGETVHQNAIKRLHEWNKHDSISPLIHDGKPLVTFSIMLHDAHHDDGEQAEHGDSTHPVASAASDVFDVDDDPDDADPGADAYVVGQVGYKDSQQLGLMKQGKVDYITVGQIQRAYDRVTASLHNIDPESGRKRSIEPATSQWGESLGRCPNASDLFNVLHRLPYANDRSPDILVIASLAICIPNSNLWIPALIEEHFEHGTDSEEWRRPKRHDYWRTMVDRYKRLIEPYII